jgi:hypothetical protein
VWRWTCLELPFTRVSNFRTDNVVCGNVVYCNDEN